MDRPLPPVVWSWLAPLASLLSWAMECHGGRGAAGDDLLHRIEGAGFDEALVLHRFIADWALAEELPTKVLADLRTHLLL
jgi:hypothetical protein